MIDLLEWSPALVHLPFNDYTDKSLVTFTRPGQVWPNQELIRTFTDQGFFIWPIAFLDFRKERPKIYRVSRFTENQLAELFVKSAKAEIELNKIADSLHKYPRLSAFKIAELWRQLIFIKGIKVPEKDEDCFKDWLKYSLPSKVDSCGPYYVGVPDGTEDFGRVVYVQIAQKITSGFVEQPIFMDSKQAIEELRLDEQTYLKWFNGHLSTLDEDLASKGVRTIRIPDNPYCSEGVLFVSLGQEAVMRLKKELANTKVDFKKFIDNLPDDDET